MIFFPSPKSFRVLSSSLPNPLSQVFQVLSSSLPNQLQVLSEKTNKQKPNTTTFPTKKTKLNHAQKEKKQSTNLNQIRAHTHKFPCSQLHIGQLHLNMRLALEWVILLEKTDFASPRRYTERQWKSQDLSCRS